MTDVLHSENAIKSEKTKSSYRRCLNAFLDFGHIAEYVTLLKLPDKKIQEMVENYVVNLKASDLNPNSIPSKLLGFNVCQNVIRYLTFDQPSS